ncbi:folylpolyglutamate synthase [Thraustotheca clavata]|uniref:Folylpolyglutamate synthase n=1 Tax=Thraustotheca clavata TaxID=74557 RepID=A0A1W0A653_9STRA|nr:folylpolyglutamate synthase [Thraustotheca clavata]
MRGYDALVRRLLDVNRFSAVKMGLKNSFAMHEALHCPASHFDTIHVAGTNGKGSVSWKLANSLQAGGFKTGLFVSPHVSCFRERIQVNGQLIREDDVEKILPELFTLTERLEIPATFFELTTMLALQHFANEKVDCVVLETGLGGRLDSTNIVTPIVSIITSIGLDHTRILGSTIEEIAKEKAGIMKRNVPVVVGPQAPWNVLQDHAQLTESPIVFVPAKELHAQDYNEENTDVATEAVKQINLLNANGKTKLRLDLQSNAVKKALESRPPCRFEVVKHGSTTVVLDVAHNMPAFESLLKLIKVKYPKRNVRFVCGFSADKDMAHVADLITAMTSPSKVHFVTGYHPRCATTTEIEAALGAKASEHFHLHQGTSDVSSVAQGVYSAIQASRKDDDVVVVCGSVFIMSEAREALGFQEPQDSEELKKIAGAGVKTAVQRAQDSKSSS